MTPRLSASFTGHRPHKLGLPQDETSPQIRALKQAMAREVDRLIRLGVTRFLSGGALGADLWGAELVLARQAQNPDLVLEMAVPYLGQTERWTSPANRLYRERYESIMRSGRIVQEYDPDPAYQTDSLQRRNKYLAEQCDYLLAVWNGSASGTGMTVRLARELGKKVIVINPLDFRDVR